MTDFDLSDVEELDLCDFQPEATPANTATLHDEHSAKLPSQQDAVISGASLRLTAPVPSPPPFPTLHD